LKARNRIKRVRLSKHFFRKMLKALKEPHRGSLIYIGQKRFYETCAPQNPTPKARQTSQAFMRARLCARTVRKKAVFHSLRHHRSICAIQKGGNRRTCRFARLRQRVGACPFF